MLLQPKERAAGGNWSIAVRLCVLAAIPLAATAQVSSTTGSVRGTISDPTSAVIPGALVWLENEALGVRRSTLTQSDGAFLFPFVPPDRTYRVIAEARNFARRVLEPVPVFATETALVNVALDLPGGRQEVETRSSVQLAGTASPALGATLDARVLTSLPLNTRDPLQLLATDAAVTSAPGGTAFYVAGSRSTFNSYTLNGVVANNFEFNSFGGVEPVPNPDALLELRTETSLYDATEGRSSGGNVNLVTRSGTSEFHGSLYVFHRHNELAANTFFLNRAGARRPFFVRTHFGASMGGPLRRRSTFWFINYEGARQRNATTVSGLAAVLPAQRDASNLGRAFGLPPSAIDPVALRILNLRGPYGGYLFPSGTQAPEGRLGRFSIAPKIFDDADQGSAKLDHTFPLWGGENRASAGAFFRRRDLRNPAGGGGSGGLGTGQIFSYTDDSFSLNDVHIFGPHWINELVLGLTVNIVDGVNGASSPALADIGMSRFNQALLSKIPNLYLTDQLSGLGPDLNSGPRQHVPQATIRETVSRDSGRQSLRLGLAAQFYQFNYAQAYGQNGQLTFTNTWADSRYGAPPAGVDDTAFRDFLIGAPSSYFLASGAPDNAFRAHDLSGFLQDDIRVSRGLTLNLGIRYDFYSNVSEKRGRWSNFDPSLVPPDAALTGGAGILKGFLFPANLPGFGTPGVGKSLLSSEDKNNFAPRLGFALDVLGDGKLALRGGYGIYFVRMSGLPALQLTGVAPFALSVSETGFRGAGILAAPFPSLPLPAEFPIPFTPPQLAGLNAGGNPIFDAPLLSITALSRDLRTPYTEHWNLTAQRALRRNLVAEIGYIGTRGVKLYDQEPLNAALFRNEMNPGAFGLAANSSANREARRPVVGISNFSIFTNSGASSYNSFIATLTARSTALFFKAAYTFSKSIDNNSASENLDIGIPQGNPFFPNLNRGLSDFDVTHRLIATYAYDLPAPPLPRRALRSIFSGWTISGITTLQSGLPFSVTQSIGDSSLTGVPGYAILKPNCSPYTSGSIEQRIDAYLNAACFTATPLLTSGTSFGPLSPFGGSGSQIYTIAQGGGGRLQGTLGRNTFRGPAVSRWDFAVSRSSPLRRLGEKGRLEFRSEFFQILNNPVFANPNAAAGSAAFGKITRTVSQIPPRQIQFALKLHF